MIDITDEIFLLVHFLVKSAQVVKGGEIYVEYNLLSYGELLLNQIEGKGACGVPHPTLLPKKTSKHHALTLLRRLNTRGLL